MAHNSRPSTSKAPVFSRPIPQANAPSPHQPAAGTSSTSAAPQFPRVFVPPSENHRPAYTGLTGAFAGRAPQHVTNDPLPGPSRSPVFRPPPPAQESPRPTPSSTDKGKGVDRGPTAQEVRGSELGEEETRSSPYARPSRVPLGQIDPAQFVARFGVQVARACGAIEDPAQGKDSNTEYTYPPPNPTDAHWLDQMQWGVQEDGMRFDDEVKRIRVLVDQATVEATLAEAEVDRELEEYERLLRDLRDVAGDDFADYLLEAAEQVELPPHREDDYEDEEVPPPDDTELFTAEEFITAAIEELVPRPPLEEDTMMEDTRPSDALSYFDPPTSPLAHRGAKRKADEDDRPNSPGPSKRQRSNAPAPMSHPSPRPSSSHSRVPPPPSPSARYTRSASCPAGGHDDWRGRYRRDQPEQDRQGSEEVDQDPPSDWSDLVSPVADPPPGWPDQLSPRWSWIKDTTAWTIAVEHLQRRRLAEAVAEAVALVRERNGGVAVGDEVEAEVEEDGAAGDAQGAREDVEVPDEASEARDVGDPRVDAIDEGNGDDRSPSPVPADLEPASAEAGPSRAPSPAPVAPVTPPPRRSRPARGNGLRDGISPPPSRDLQWRSIERRGPPPMYGGNWRSPQIS
ncbi:hypothetical protein C8Q77DRAFT_1228211 [Trametes polyzona]|nr:hypothetical protein C8Q77DRAFT_1228211 [Trametes polyzona]